MHARLAKLRVLFVGAVLACAFSYALPVPRAFAAPCIRDSLRRHLRPTLSVSLNPSALGPRELPEAGRLLRDSDIASKSLQLGKLDPGEYVFMTTANGELILSPRIPELKNLRKSKFDPDLSSAPFVASHGSLLARFTTITGDIPELTSAGTFRVTEYLDPVTKRKRKVVSEVSNESPFPPLDARAKAASFESARTILSDHGLKLDPPPRLRDAQRTDVRERLVPATEEALLTLRYGETPLFKELSRFRAELAGKYPDPHIPGAVDDELIQRALNHRMDQLEGQVTDQQMSRYWRIYQTLGKLEERGLAKVTEDLRSQSFSYDEMKAFLDEALTSYEKHRASLPGSRLPRLKRHPDAIPDPREISATGRIAGRGELRALPAGKYVFLITDPESKIIYSNRVPVPRVNPNDPSAQFLATHRSLYNQLSQAGSTPPEIRGAGEFEIVEVLGHDGKLRNEVRFVSGKTGSFRVKKEHLDAAVQDLKAAGLEIRESTPIVHFYDSASPLRSHYSELEEARMVLNVPKDEIYQRVIGIHQKLVRLFPHPKFPGTLDSKRAVEAYKKSISASGPKEDLLYHIQLLALWEADGILSSIAKAQSRQRTLEQIERLEEIFSLR